MSQLIKIEKLQRENNITEREQSFCESLQEYWKRHGQLTDKQWNAFDRMASSYNPAVISARKNWSESWNEEKASNLKIAAKYYLNNPPYFTDISTKIIHDPEYVPTEKLYNKMVLNKYTQKVLATTAAPPLFEIGSLVKIRATYMAAWAASPIALPSRRKDMRNRNAIVVKNDGEVVRAGKGAKKYTILPFGEPNTLEIEERYLKKHRG
jgi:hypothetical protein